MYELTIWLSNVGIDKMAAQCTNWLRAYSLMTCIFIDDVYKLMMYIPIEDMHFIHCMSCFWCRIYPMYELMSCSSNVRVYFDGAHIQWIFEDVYILCSSWWHVYLIYDLMTFILNYVRLHDTSIDRTRLLWRVLYPMNDLMLMTWLSNVRVITGLSNLRIDDMDIQSYLYINEVDIQFIHWRYPLYKIKDVVIQYKTWDMAIKYLYKMMTRLSIIYRLIERYRAWYNMSTCHK